VRLGRSDPIHHFESPRRDFRRMDLYGRRNNVLFAWHHAPASWLPACFVATTWNALKHGLSVGRPRVMLEGLARGYAGILSDWKNRAPVSAALFSLYREMVHRKVLPYEEIENRLSAILSAAGSNPPRSKPVEA
jgi:hypothetical protein